ncbi:MAG: SDR family NAD(P)-dependent oxidoreductase [Armatimonadota bacterium]|nr:SDR family NAD(P)-dependent oxidoreductase [Armatimonadota bacterium]
MPRTWFITGASRGLGAEIAKAALRSGDRVVATGRKKEAVAGRLGVDSESLLSLGLDVTNPAQVKAAVADSGVQMEFVTKAFLKIIPRFASRSSWGVWLIFDP